MTASLGYHFTFHDTRLTLLPSGALWWPDERLLCISDLHLGKAERMARRGGHLLPPFDTKDTLARLEHDLRKCHARTVICLGDSFDDLDAAHHLPDDEKDWLNRMMAGRQWIWIEGNHDPGPVGFGGSHQSEFSLLGLQFRHIADPDKSGEISGHYHPKARISLRGRALSRPCMLQDQNRLILPAFGTYTGGLRSDDSALCNLMKPDALAVLLGSPPRAIPMPRKS